MAIANGVGDRQSAGRGSALAVETANTHLLNSVSIPSLDNDFDEPQLLDEFKVAVEECREAMQREVEAADRFDAMGAVLTLAYVTWPAAYVMHVGNSRAYHWHRESITQVTTDHTMARRLLDASQLSPNQAKYSDLRHVVWNLIGTQTEDTNPEFIPLRLEINDALVLCSDGMSSLIGEREIAESLKATKTAEETCEHLLAKAMHKQMEDDATIVVARFADTSDMLEQQSATEIARPEFQQGHDNAKSKRAAVKAKTRS